METALPELLRAVRFAAEKHRDQRRKDAAASPYVNHPIEVADVLARTAGVTDLAVLQAALLHDTIEDTETTAEELEALFGADVRSLVEELTDDKRLPKAERKRLQIRNAPGLSPRAKLIELADKLCNVRDLVTSPPASWSFERCSDYVGWAARVVAGCRGVNAALEQACDEALQTARRALQG